MLMTKLIFYCS